MSFFKTSPVIVAALATALASSAAMATSAQWDSAAAGYSGLGTSSATAWIDTLPSDSSYAEWNVILGYPVDNTPDIAGSGTLTETTGTAFATGSGNIYGFNGPSAFNVTLAGSTTGTWDVYLRVAALGSAVTDVATLNGLSGTRVLTYSGAASGGFGGAEEESLWKWTLSGAALWSFNFSATAAHMSLDQVAVYATPSVASVPEPASWALMLAGLGAVGTLRQRRLRR